MNHLLHGLIFIILYYNAVLVFVNREGIVTKRSGGHRRVTNCLGCGACCVCKCSVWRERYLATMLHAYVEYIIIVPLNSLCIIALNY